MIDETMRLPFIIIITTPHPDGWIRQKHQAMEI
jgi:hypothetical protein